MNLIISIKNLVKSYGHDKALDGLSLEVAQGEFLGFLGPNGAGKTTTIRILTGIIQPDSGEVTHNNARDIGVVPESRGFYDWMTAREYLTFFANLYGVQDSNLKVDSLLKQVGILERSNSKIGTFSRGMKQRLGLARALINDPKILFLDEPTLGLDPQGQEDIQNLLRQLNKQGVTIFFSSHQLNEVANLCSRVAIINHGKLIGQGTIAELQQQANLPNSSLKDIFLNLTTHKHV